MPLAKTVLLATSSASAHGTGTYTTTSFTPANNSLLLIVCGAMVGNTGTGMNGSSLTITDTLGSPLTYTSRAATGAPPSWEYGLRMWTAPVTTGASMQLVFDCGTTNIQRYAVVVYEFTGHDGATPTAGAITGNDADGDGTFPLTLGATPASGDYVVAAVVVQNNATGATSAGASWAEDHDVAEDGWFSFQAQSITGVTSTSVAWTDITTSGTPVDAVGAALIIKAAAGGSGGLLNAFRKSSLSGGFSELKGGMRG